MWEQRSITAINRSPLNGVATTLERVGAQLAVRLKYETLFENERARMQAFLSACRGHGSRFYVPYYGWTNRGSFSASELLSNNFFASGTTGWTAASATLDVQDQVGRIVHDGTFSVLPQINRSATVVQYAPYVARALLTAGRGSFGSGGVYIANPGVFSMTDYASGLGMRTASLVALSTTIDYAAVAGSNTSGYSLGDFVECHYTSLSRCAQVDNGQNLFQRSDELDNAYWTKSNATVSANSDQSPFGTTTADRLVEDGTTSQHRLTRAITVTSDAQDVCIAIAARAQGRNFIVIGVTEGTGATSAETFFNLATGATGSGSTGGNWSNRRSFITPLGNSWYMCHLVVRKTNAATALTAYFMLGSADGTSSYAGDSSSAVRLSRATFAPSSVPTRLVQTTSASTTGTAQTGGALHLKGLPASTNGLLSQGDPAEVITVTSSQLVRSRSALNSGAAGLGYFQFEAPLRVSPADGAPVIIQRPLCRMMLDSNTVQWTEHSGGFCDLEFTAVEDTYP